MAESFDVIVVGGGPAGAAAAISSVNRGLSVCLVERDQFPRDRPGETLHPGVQPLLALLGVEAEVLAAGFLRHPGIWVGWNDKPNFQAFGHDHEGPWLGFQAPRRDLDSILLNRARQSGAIIIQPCRKTAPIVAEQRVMGVAVDGSDLSARFVIDAAGGSHWIARHLALNIERHSPKLIARYGYLDTSDTPDDRLPLIISQGRGWLWTAKISNGLYTWTRLDLEPARADGALPVSDSCYSIGGISKKGADVTWRFLERPAGAGYIVAGDAAMVLDPASSHGVLKAIMSGIMAAHLICQMLDEPLLEADLIGDYCEWLRVGFLKDKSILEDLYANLPHAPSWCRSSI